MVSYFIKYNIGTKGEFKKFYWKGIEVLLEIILDTIKKTKLKAINKELEY